MRTRCVVMISWRCGFDLIGVPDVLAERHMVYMLLLLGWGWGGGKEGDEELVGGKISQFTS